MKLAQQAPPAPPGGFYAPQWPEEPLLDATSGHLFRTASRHTGFNSRSYKMRKRARPGDGQAGVHTASLVYYHFGFNSRSYKMRKRARPGDSQAGVHPASLFSVNQTVIAASSYCWLPVWMCLCAYRLHQVHCFRKQSCRCTGQGLCPWIVHVVLYMFC